MPRSRLPHPGRASVKTNHRSARSVSSPPRPAAKIQAELKLCAGSNRVRTAKYAKKTPENHKKHITNEKKLLKEGQHGGISLVFRYKSSTCLQSLETLADGCVTGSCEGTSNHLHHLLPQCTWLKGWGPCLDTYTHTHALSHT